jgi:Flp pilus assembly protein protease CpaA
MDMVQFILLFCLIAWLLVCMIFDLRYREVPMKWMLVPMIAAGVYALFQAQFVLVLQTAVLIIISDFKPYNRRLFLAALVSVLAGIFDPSCVIQVMALFLIWLLWENGAMGGADTKLLMVIALVIAQPIVFLFIALVGGIQGVIAIFARQKKVPYIVAIFAGTCLYAINVLALHIL